MKNRKNGFTLVEILVVMGIFVTIASVFAGILYTTLRSNNKARVANAVALNGNYALSMISNIIVGGKKAEVIGDSNCAGVLGTEVKITDMNNGVSIITCSGTNLKMVTPLIPNPGALLFDSSVRLTTCSFSCTQADLYSPPSVTINISLAQANAGALYESSSNINNFSTTVTLRNYKFR